MKRNEIEIGDNLGCTLWMLIAAAALVMVVWLS